MKKIRVGRSGFFLLLSVCMKAFFFQSEKHSSFNIHAFHIFMFTHVLHVPQVLRKKKIKKNKKNTALVQKIMGQSGDFFFFFKLKKNRQKTKVGRFFEGR